MRIALVYPRSANDGGVEFILSGIARHCGESGHQVTIVCRSHEAPPHPSVQFARMRPFAIGSLWRAWAFVQACSRHLDKSGYDRVLALGRTTGHNVIRLGMGCHATYMEKVGLTRVTLRDKLEMALEARSLAPAGFRGPRRVIVNSVMVKKDAMTRYGLAENEIRVIPNGTNLERFHPKHRSEAGLALRKELGINDAQPVLLYLGTGFRRKGLDVILDAMPAILNRHPNARLLVVGRDGRESLYRSQASQLGVDSAVHFAGGRRDVEAWYAAADLYFLPTRYDTFGVSVLEALASGTPAITTAAAGAGEVIKPDCGTVIPAPPSSSDLAAAALDWLTPGRIPQARPLCRALAEQYDIRDCAARMTRYLCGED